MIVRRINAKDTYFLRQKILRPNANEDACHFEGDEDELTFHLGAFVDNKIVSIASFYFISHPDIKDEYQFRLRGMATLEEYRNKGFSSALLKTAFPHIKNNQCTVLWCNARLTAKGFYQKVGFETIGEEFEIEGIGPHIVMVKKVI
jgi:predicted GNAT family N-acyltransferase